MGKDINKRLLNNNSPSRLYSPWQDDNETISKRVKRSASKFGLFDNLGTFMDDDMVNTIQLIEKEQNARIERNREEDIMDEVGISRNVESLGISSLSSLEVLDPSKFVPFTLSAENLALVDVLSIPEKQQTPLVTLEEAIQLNYIHKDPTKVQSSLSVSNPKVVEIYKKIGDSLAHYQSGKIPKALKIIPSLPNWDAILCLSNPTKWTSQATLEVTKIFMTNVKATQTKQYFQFVLLPSVRYNLVKNNNHFLDTSLYLALQKGISCCPALFFKGFLFPLLESSSCTLTEATLLASIIQQARIPALHTATALLHLTEIPLYTLSISVLVLSFLEKRQTLPYRVVDSLVNRYFCQRQEEIALPLIWYETLLLFVNSYGMDLVPTQKRKLLGLMSRVKQNEMTNVIAHALENSMKNAIDEDEADSDGTSPTVHYDEEDHTREYERDSDGMMVD